MVDFRAKLAKARALQLNCECMRLEYRGRLPLSMDADRFMRGLEEELTDEGLSFLTRRTSSNFFITVDCDGPVAASDERVQMALRDLTQRLEAVDDKSLIHTRCAVCGEEQLSTPSGLTCPNGHGGAPSVTPDPGQGVGEPPSAQPTVKPLFEPILPRVTAESPRGDDKHPVLTSMTNDQVAEAMDEGFRAALPAVLAILPKYEQSEEEPETPPLPPLSAEQQAAFDRIMNESGHFFLTGKAGTGKSFLVKHLLATGKCKATATTARAALIVGGCTVDRLFCFSRTDWEIRNYKKLDENMRGCPAKIIIDEGSMIGTKMARVLYKVAQQYRKQLIIVGDLAQAAPVKDDWLVNSPLFAECQKIKLVESHRQADGVFLSVLDKLRQGVVDDQVREVMKPCVVPESPDDDTFLRFFATNKTADSYNQQRLHALPAENRAVTVETRLRDERSQHLQKEYPFKEDELKKYIDEGNFAHEEQFRVGARVILTKNDLEGRFVNGDTGWLVDIRLQDGSSIKDAKPFNPFIPEAKLAEVEAFIVELDRGHAVEVGMDTQAMVDASSRPIYSLTGYPIRLGWAITIHRGQGMTLEKAFVDMNTIAFMPGESKHGLGYVALSRTRELSGLRIANWRDDVIVCADVVRPYV